MRKVYNFGAGPGMLPEEVLLTAQAEMLDWHGTGMSIMELGHRGSAFKQVAETAERDLRELMGIPDHYHILFLPGGATAQFAMVPLNLFGAKCQANYVDTGVWSKKAIDEAKRYGTVNVVAKLVKQDGLVYIPPQCNWQQHDNIDFLHYTPNETIEGIEFNWVPQVANDIPLVADMSSMILSRPIKVSDYGVIYAGAQKNIGQAGITIVIIRGDLIRDVPDIIPTLYQYKVHAENHSFYNTPPTYSWYLAGLVFAWMKTQGGVSLFYEKNLKKAALLYQFIDEHPECYVTEVHPSCRSLMNVVFNLRDTALLPMFLAEANKAHLTNLKGHRVVGGLRASIYNAMPLEGVISLIQFMDEFAKKYS